MAGLEAGKPFTNLKIEVSNVVVEAAEEGEVEDEEAEARMEHEEEMEEGEASDDDVEVNVILKPPQAPPVILYLPLLHTTCLLFQVLVDFCCYCCWKLLKA